MKREAGDVVAIADEADKMLPGRAAPGILRGRAYLKLNKPADACKVYAELEASYGSKIGPDLKAKAAQGRADAKCK